MMNVFILLKNQGMILQRMDEVPYNTVVLTLKEPLTSFRLG